jgi:hypothetical protein
MPAKLSTPKRLQHISTLGRARLPGDGGQHASRLSLAWPRTGHQPHTAGQARQLITPAWLTCLGGQAVRFARVAANYFQIAHALPLRSIRPSSETWLMVLCTCLFVQRVISSISRVVNGPCSNSLTNA